MRTVRSSSRLLQESGGAWSWGDAWSWGVPGPGGCLVPGGCLLREVPGPGGCLLQGVPGPGGVCSQGMVSQHALRQTTPSPLWTEWLTDRCKNITFATSLRTVIMHSSRMRTARSLPYLGGVSVREPPQKDHGTRQPDRKWHHTQAPYLRFEQNDRCE